MTAPDQLRADALRIWHSGLDAVRPEFMIRRAFQQFDRSIYDSIHNAPRILVVGCGKAGAAMAHTLEQTLLNLRDRLVGVVNVPQGGEAARWKLVFGDADRVIGVPSFRIRLHEARPTAVNFPTKEGVAGAEEMLRLLGEAGPDDVAICLLSGGGSALLPAPVDGVSLEDKQAVTKLLHASGAAIGEMNAVRKHLSRVKGGRPAEAFRGKLLVSLIISDVVGDPLDVIASGPTTPDPTTFADAMAILEKYGLRERAPRSVIRHLERGVNGEVPETPKSLPANVHNVVIGNNTIALQAARSAAEQLRYHVLDLGPFIEGETRQVATVVAGIVRNIREHGEPVSAPACILLGGETTVTLGASPGKGGRNQEFVLTVLEKLGRDGMGGVTVLSAGTDGEDGPTDAAGAVATQETWDAALRLGLDPAKFLAGHDAYPFFDATGGLIRTGLTNTNVMDVRVILVT